MTKLLTLLAAGLLTTSAFATTTLHCKSASFMIQVSDRIIALSLDVDGQESKFELSATKTGNGKYAGQIFSEKAAEAATCTRK